MFALEDLIRGFSTALEQSYVINIFLKLIIAFSLRPLTDE
jgi:hypothetical protein